MADAKATPASAPAPDSPKQPTVAVVGPDNRIWDVPADEMGQLPPDVHLPTEKEFHKERIHKEYGDTASGIGTASLGALDMATFGGSTYLAGQLGGPEWRRKIAETREENPGWWLGGQGVGLIADPFGAVGAVGKAGGIAERAAQAIVGEGAENFGARALQSAVANSARGAVEAGAFGAAQGLSEAAITDPDHVAEHVVSGLQGGALWGLAGGAALGVLGEAGSSAAKAGVNKISQILGEKDIGAWAKGIAEKQAAEAMGFKQGDFRRIGKTIADEDLETGEKFYRRATLEEQQAEWRAHGRAALDEGVVKAGASKADMAAKVEDVVAEKSGELKKMQRELDGGGIKFDAKKFSDQVVDKITTPLLDRPLGDAALKEVSQYMRRFLKMSEEKGGLTFEKVFELKSELGQDLKGVFGKAPDAPISIKNRAMKQLYGVLADELTSQGTIASKQLGTTFADKYASTNSLVSKMLNMREVLSREGAAEFAHGIKSSDYLAGAAGAIAGAASHGVTGSITGMAAGAAHKYLRTHGNSIAADFLNRITAVDRLMSASNRAQKVISEKVGNIFEGGKRVSRAAIEKELAQYSTRERYDKIRGELDNFAQHPEAQQAMVSRAVAPISVTAPKVAESAAIISMRATAFLQSKAPPKMQEGLGELFPGAGRAKPAGMDPDELRFMRFVRALERPESVFEDMAEGKLPFEGLEALHVVMPKYWETARALTVEKLSKRDPKDKLSDGQVISLGLLLDLPTHHELNPEFIKGVQAAAGQGGESQSPREKPGRVDDTSVKALSGKLQTTSDDIESPDW